MPIHRTQFLCPGGTGKASVANPQCHRRTAGKRGAKRSAKRGAATGGARATFRLSFREFSWVAGSGFFFALPALGALSKRWTPVPIYAEGGAAVLCGAVRPIAEHGASLAR